MLNLIQKVTAPRKKVYPRHINGRFHRLRSAVSVVLQALLFSAPWLLWKGQPAVLADIPGRKLFLFNLVIQPQETYFLHLMLLMGGVTLFASTALAGRLWCGYACPQTLFSQAFIAVERFFEGDRAARIRLDKAPWSASKVRIKLSKFAVWTAMGLWLGVTWAGYFTPIRPLLQDLASGQPERSTVAMIGFFAGISLFFFGWFREQFCCYLCPYARFQGAMFDADSLIIGYDAKRGEPRGKATSSDSGDCVNCTMCVQVCPTGIDIRNGLQLECISCAACVDACDEVMDKLSRPRGLVRYTSLQELQGKKTRWVRPRLVIYGVILTVLASVFLVLLAERGPIGLSLVRQSPGGGKNFGISPDGRILNTYRVHVVNRTREPQVVNLSLPDFPGAELVSRDNPCQLGPGEVATLGVIVLHPQDGLRYSRKFSLRAVSGATQVDRQANFLSP